MADNQNSLDLREIINAINLCQQESQKFATMANTLTKCALLVQSLLQQQSTATQPEPDAPPANPEALS